MMSSAGEEGNIQAQGCASATNLLKDLPRANPGISALHPRFVMTLEMQPGMKKRGGIAAHFPERGP